MDLEENPSPVVQIKSRKHRLWAVKWFFGRFPPRNPSAYVDNYDELAARQLETLQRNLTQQQMDDNAEEEVKQAMDKLMRLESEMKEEMMV